MASNQFLVTAIKQLDRLRKHGEAGDSSELITAGAMAAGLLCREASIALRVTPELSQLTDPVERALFSTEILFGRTVRLALESRLTNATAEISTALHIAAQAEAQISDLQYLYEQLIDESGRKRRGVVFTPPAIIDRLVSSALELHQKPAPPLVLDPACGSGLFLTAMLTQLVRRYGRQQAFGIRGIDIDPGALGVARLALRFVAAQLDLKTLPDETALVQANTLLDESWPEASQHGGALPHQFTEQPIDIVIGNPPYGMSRGKRIDPVENKYLKQRYSRYRSGRINQYQLFIARAFELLGDGGILSFIVPNAWLGVREARALREFLINQGAIREIVYYHCPVFAERGVEPIRLLARKNGGNTSFEVRHVGDLSETMLRQRTVVSVEALKRDSDLQIPLTTPQTLVPLLTKLSEKLKLGEAASPFRPLIALQAYAEGKGVPPQSAETVRTHPFHARSAIDPSYIPYLAGGDISRFQIKWSGSYLSWGPWLAESQKLSRFTGPRVVLREVVGRGDRLIYGTYTDQPYLYNKSVLHIRGAEDPEQLEALLLTLNSKFGSFVLAARGRKSQRKLFPKIVLDDLKDFPLAAPMLNQPAELAAVARELKVAHNSAAPPVMLNELEAHADKLVYETYQLSQAERLEIEAFLNSRLL